MPKRQLYHFRSNDRVVAFDPREEHCPISEGIWTVVKVTRVFDTCDCGLKHPLDGRHQQGCSSLLGERSASGHPQYILVKREDSSENIQKEISGWWAKPAEGQEVTLLEPLANWCAPKVEPFQIFEAGRMILLRDAEGMCEPMQVTSTFRVADACTCHLMEDRNADEPHGPKCGMRLGMRLHGHPQYVLMKETGGIIFTGDQLVYADSPAPPAKK